MLQSALPIAIGWNMVCSILYHHDIRRSLNQELQFKKFVVDTFHRIVLRLHLCSAPSYPAAYCLRAIIPTGLGSERGTEYPQCVDLFETLEML